MLQRLLTVIAGFATAAAFAAEPDADALLKEFAGGFVTITPGKEPFPATMTLGSDTGPDNEQPTYTVRLQQFAIHKYEVTQNLYEAVMGQNPSRWKGVRNSAEMMTWADAMTFCSKATKRLSEQKLIAANEEIRLPSEAEWEYACRAGTNTAYSFGDAIRRDDDSEKKNSILDEFAWYTGNAAGNDPPVGAKQPNPWGLYDVHGYLWEFTADGWTPNHRGAAENGSAKWPGNPRDAVVIRGGSWKDGADALRSASRKSFGQQAKDDAVGFRCVKATVRK